MNCVGGESLSEERGVREGVAVACAASCLERKLKMRPALCKRTALAPDSMQASRRAMQKTSK